MEYEKGVTYIATHETDGSYEGVLFNFVAQQEGQVLIRITGQYVVKCIVPWEVGDEVILRERRGWSLVPACPEFLEVAKKYES